MAGQDSSNRKGEASQRDRRGAGTVRAPSVCEQTEGNIKTLRQGSNSVPSFHTFCYKGRWCPGSRSAGLECKSIHPSIRPSIYPRVVVMGVQATPSSAQQGCYRSVRALVCSGIGLGVPASAEGGFGVQTRIWLHVPACLPAP